MPQLKERRTMYDSQECQSNNLDGKDPLRCDSKLERGWAREILWMHHWKTIQQHKRDM